MPENDLYSAPWKDQLLIFAAVVVTIFIVIATFYVTFHIGAIVAILIFAAIYHFFTNVIFVLAGYVGWPILALIFLGLTKLVEKHEKNIKNKKLNNIVNYFGLFSAVMLVICTFVSIFMIQARLFA
jgi:hypothetical protein